MIWILVIRKAANLGEVRVVVKFVMNIDRITTRVVEDGEHKRNGQRWNDEGSRRLGTQMLRKVQGLLQGAVEIGRSLQFPHKHSNVDVRQKKNLIQRERCV